MTESEIPRRYRLDKHTPAEAAIRAAVNAVEDLPPDVRLTDAVALLQNAMESVADYVDGKAEMRRIPHFHPWPADPSEEG